MHIITVSLSYKNAFRQFSNSSLQKKKTVISHFTKSGKLCAVHVDYEVYRGGLAHNILADT